MAVNAQDDRVGAFFAILLEYKHEFRSNVEIRWKLRVNLLFREQPFFKKLMTNDVRSGYCGRSNQEVMKCWVLVSFWNAIPFETLVIPASRK